MKKLKIAPKTIPINAHIIIIIFRFGEVGATGGDAYSKIIELSGLKPDVIL